MVVAYLYNPFHFITKLLIYGQFWQSSKMFIDIEDTDYKIDGSYYLCGNY